MRKSLLALAATGLAFALTACGSPTTTTSTSPSATDGNATAASGSLTIWADETRVAAFQALGEKFQQETGIALEVTQKPTADIKTDFITQAPTGEGPDLIVGAHDWLGDLVPNGVVAPVELGDKAAGFSEAARQGFIVDGVTYGVPYAVENVGLVRNNALATETPATFDELVAQGKQLTPEFPVLLQQGDKGDPYHLYPVQSSFGATVFKTNDQGEYIPELNMTGEAGEQFAAYIKKLGEEGVLSPSIGGGEAKQAFLDGKSAYIITGPWWPSEFKAAGLDVSVVPIPSAGGQPAAPFIGVQGVYLSSNSKDPLGANRFIEFMTSEEAQKSLQELGGRVSALESVAATVEDPIAKGFAEAGADSKPMPAIPAMGSVWEFWGAAEVSILTGADPAATWQEMTTQIQNSIAKN
ncbi:MAG: maltose ABC transporter substrate-binding protein [Propionibacteriaceae bacterium]|nr:maltose ABC transporter substrate-binding protein [Propionibacteriaceae bacterium]